MRQSSSKRLFLMLGLAAASGCASSGGGANTATSLTACFPQQCQLEVQNHNGRVISVRYSDSSTGVGDVLGSVAGASNRRFTLPRRTSRSIIVDVELEGTRYRAQIVVPSRPDDSLLHFPDDFEKLAKG